MFRKDFCEINMLKEMIASRKSWPNVIINTCTKEEYRTDIKGTLSLFSSNKGVGYYSAGCKKLAVGTDTFFISNEHQHYGIDIHQTAVVETFNIHFSTQMLRKLVPTLIYKQEQLLDRSEYIGDLNFSNKLYWKDDFFRKTSALLQQKSATGELNDMMTDELLSSLLEHLLVQQSVIKRNIDSLAVNKLSTRTEVVTRLCTVIDYIHEHYSSLLTLDELALVACMSKFHFLRMFKQVYRLTPYQYIMYIRLDKAKHLLATSSLLVSDIATSVGYDDISTFSRGFKRKYGYWPMMYRTLIGN